MLRALTNDVDIGIVDRAHVIVDHDRAFDRETGAHADLRVRPDAGSEMTISQSRLVSSLKTRPSTFSLPFTSLVNFFKWTWIPIPSIAFLRMAPAVTSSCISRRWPARCTTWDWHPSTVIALAASRPSRPPPIVTTTLLFFAYSTIAAQSSIVRYPNTPGFSLPSLA